VDGRNPDDPRDAGSVAVIFGDAAACGGDTAVAAPATATPARNFRRSTFMGEFLRATLTSPSIEATGRREPMLFPRRTRYQGLQCPRAPREIARQTPSGGAKPAAILWHIIAAAQPGDFFPAALLERLGQSRLG
jgi:hypothetical protein